MDASIFPLSPERTAVVAVDHAAEQLDELVVLIGAYDGSYDEETLRCALRAVGALVVAQEALRRA